MNLLESRMLEILKFGHENGLYLGVKAEFEAEGTRTEEMIRLSDIVRRSGLKLGIKIGGCEAVRDLIDCKQIGADYIIAPMVESPYALSKYIQMKNNIYSAYEQENTDFLFNIETEGTLTKLDAVLDLATKVDGIVFGRVDYTGSCGLTRADINSERVTNDVIRVAKGCKQRNLDLVVGGGVSFESLSNIRQIHREHLTRFETRKIIFSAACLDSDMVEEAFARAGEFELLWLKNKHDYYARIAAEDQTRITMLEDRLKKAAGK